MGIDFKNQTCDRHTYIFLIVLMHVVMFVVCFLFLALTSSLIVPFINPFSTGIIGASIFSCLYLYKGHKNGKLCKTIDLMRY